VGRVLLGFTICVACISPAANADPVTFQYSTGFFFQDNIGNVGIPGEFDALLLTGFSNVLTLQSGQSVIAPLNPFTFFVGPTGLPTPNPVPLSISRPVSVFGSTKDLTQNAEVLIGGTDSLSIFTGSAVEFPLGANALLRITPLSASAAFVPGGTAEGVIDGRFEVAAVPEPASVLLTSTGLFALLANRRVRRRLTQYGVGRAGH
jgi:hypothetical protein